MPAKLDRCVKKVKKSGKDTTSAFKICNKSINSKKKKKKRKK